MQQIEQWTFLKMGEILFHWEIDDWSHGTSTFHEKIIGKKNVLIFIESNYNCKFGFYLNELIPTEKSLEFLPKETSFEREMQFEREIPIESKSIFENHFHQLDYDSIKTCRSSWTMGQISGLCFQLD